MARMVFRPKGQKLEEFIEIEEQQQGRHFLCVSSKRIVYLVHGCVDMMDYLLFMLNYDRFMIKNVCIGRWSEIIFWILKMHNLAIW